MTGGSNGAAPTHGGHGHGKHTNEHGHSHSFEAVLFPFLAVLVGCVVTYLMPRSRAMRIFPYTVWLFVIGIVFGALDLETNHSLGTLSRSLGMWENMDPHLLLYTFLPVLLFGDSMNINFHEFYNSAAQCTMLAGPGVLLGTGLMYVVAFHLFPYGWTTSEAAAFGSVLAATDPVAVVALLNEMGAAPMLTMQIAGESLLNDGTAIVVWSLFNDLMIGKELKSDGIVIKFIRLAFGGLFFGVLVGVIALRGITLASDKLVHADHMVQLAITFCAAYLAFFIGEHELEVSGVLATIFCALTLGKCAWPMVCEPDTVRHVWHTCEFFGNTVLFQLAGAIFYESTHRSVHIEDWGWLAVLYILATMARGLMMVLFYPYLNAVAPCKAAKISWKECIVMTWGGLRGAVGLALALTMRAQLYLDGKSETGDKMVFFVGGFAAMTLFINATTCSLVLQMLGITKPPEAREKLLVRLQAELLAMAVDECKHLVATDMRFAACSISSVEAILHHQVHHHHKAHKGPVHKGHNEPVSMFALFQSKAHVHLKEIDATPIGSTKPDASEKRIDPESGDAITLEEMRTIHAGKYTEQEISEYWEACIPAMTGGDAPADDVDAKVAMAKDTRPLLRAFTKISVDMDEKKIRADSKDREGSCHSCQSHWWWGFDPIDAGNLLAQKTREFDEVSEKDLEHERLYYLSMLKAQYEKQTREDMIPASSRGSIQLPSSVDGACDFAHVKFMDWVVLKSAILRKSHPIYRILKVLGLSAYSDIAPIRMKDGRVFDLFSIVVFMDAHHLVCARLAEDQALRSTARSLIVQEAGREVEEAHKFLTDNKVGHQQIGAVRTRQLLSVLFAKQHHQVHAWLHKGIVNDGEAEELMHHVHESMHQKSALHPALSSDLERGTSGPELSPQWTTDRKATEELCRGTSGPELSPQWKTNRKATEELHSTSGLRAIGSPTSVSPKSSDSSPAPNQRPPIAQGKKA